MLKPDTDKIIPLPAAFKQEKIEMSLEDGTPKDWIFNEPSNNFSIECSKFANDILLMVQSINKSDTPLVSKTFKKWADEAKDIWDLIEKYPDIIVYKTIKEM